MTAKEQTEKLKNTFFHLILPQVICPNRSSDESILVAGKLVIIVLQACKEAGLKFVLPVITSDPEAGNERIEEIEL